MSKKIERICENCKRVFYVYFFIIKKGQGKYCSNKCRGASQRSNHVSLYKECLVCGKEFKISPFYIKKRKYCSRECMNKSIEYRKKKSKSLMRDKHFRWKGGRGVSNRHILILSPNHPYKNKDNYVYEHRLVMEKHLGRYLFPAEVVHHVNKDTLDNRIENLMLFSNQAEHNKHHAKVRALAKNTARSERSERF